MNRAARRIAPEEPPEISGAPAGVQPYLRALGSEDTVKLLLAMGGSEIYLAANPRPDSQIAAVIGVAAVEALGRELGIGQRVKVPLAKAFLARFFKDEGWTNAAIARTLRIDESTVRKKLRGGLLPSKDQLKLF